MTGMLQVQHRLSHVYVLPETLAASVVATAHALATSGEVTTPEALGYCEKRGGFQCRTCVYVTPANATHGRCALLGGVIHLDEGCCVAWDANPALLHLYREGLT